MKKASKTVFAALGMASLTLIGIASADEITREGYLLDSRGNVARNSFNECWKAGNWTPAMAIAECDSGLVKKMEPKKVEAVVPAAEPSVAPVESVAVPAAPVLVPITLQAEKLFDFDKSVIRPDGKTVLNDEVVNKLKASSQVEVVVTGHADRIGSEFYNQGLSQRRADAVKAYLVEQGIEESHIETVAKGESQPLVSCDDVKGEVSGKNRKLVDCLQPNRRVVVEAKGQVKN